ncbi:MAG TPA: SIS domain-containing protein [Limnochordia bacterium]|nr:SIS domain-containing protein [Limnochordia bacterium]
MSGAAALLAVARRRVWFGIGDSAHLAASADHRCAVLGLPSQAVSAGSHLTALLPSLGAGDCLVVISQSGRTRPAAGALRASGVPVIGLTSVATSPLAKLSDYLLLTPPSDFIVGDSPYTVRAAQALVIDALLLEAGTRRGTRIEGWS